MEKKKRKIYQMKRFLMLVIMICVVATTSACGNSKSDTFGKIVVGDVKTGSGNSIGEYAVVDASNVEFTQEVFIDFYNENIKDSGYNWFSMKINDTIGIQFPGSSIMFTVGSLDEEARIINAVGHGFIQNNEIDYTEE